MPKLDGRKSAGICAYAGAIARVNSPLCGGKISLISVKMPDGGIPPMGADVFNGEAQTSAWSAGGQIYAVSLIRRVLYWCAGEQGQTSMRCYQLDLHARTVSLSEQKLCEKE